MDNDFVKQLTGKNPKEYEFAAAHIINDCDVEAFQALVEKSDFLFEFIKENVKKRLSDVITNSNYKNLLSFLKIYSFDYEDFIISTLVKFADEDLTDEMLEKLEFGSDEEKTYCAKYFSHINDSPALDILRKTVYSEFVPLALNSAEALCAFGDKDFFEEALKKLNSEDEFEKLSAVKFLAVYKDDSVLDSIFKTMKTSSMSEYIAAEIPYIKPFLWLFDNGFEEDTLLAINNILNGFGEIIPLSQVFDFEFFDLFNRFIEAQNQENNPKIALILLKAKEKFINLTENDEYIFDEDKNIKAEVHEIRNLLNAQPEKFWEAQKKHFLSELAENSNFVFSALEIVQEMNITEAFDKLKELLNSSNQTIILKTIEVLKTLNKLEEINQSEVLNKISDGNIKLIIQSMF